MKLIIDIDEDYYKIIKHDVDNGMDYLPCVLIANGTPILSDYEGCADFYEGIRFGLRTVLEIIDKYKAESEDKE